MRASGILAENVARLDQQQSEIAARLNDLQGKPPTDGDLFEMSTIQSRFDSAYRQLEMIGAPGPLNGEQPSSYRRRLLKTLQPLSQGWRDSDVFSRHLSEGVVDNIEAAVLQDVQKVVGDPTRGSFRSPGKLRAIESTGEGGHRIREYKGDPIEWMGAFMVPAGIGRIRDPRRG